LVVAGGVGANRLLRNRLKEALAGQGGSVYFPRPEFCTDNGAMVAFAGLLRFQAGAATSRASSRLAVEARARWNLQEI
jgi:N6-L-threonylcarbamoyladenine synthase